MNYDRASFSQAWFRDPSAPRLPVGEALEIYEEMGDERGIARTRLILQPARLSFEIWAEQNIAQARERGDLAAICQALALACSKDLKEGRLEAAKSLLEQSAAMGRDLGFPFWFAWSLHHLGQTLYAQGDYDRACQLVEEALTLRKKIGDRRGAAFSLWLLGALAQSRGDTETARRRAEASLALFREIDASYEIPCLRPLICLGDAARERGEYAVSHALLAEGLALARQIHDPWGLPVALYSLGRLALAEGDPAAAWAHFRESLSLLRATGFRLHLVRCLEGIAATWAVPRSPLGPVEHESPIAPADAGRAARLLGAASAHREALGAALSPEDRPLHERSVAVARAALGEAAFAAARTEGQGMTLDDAVASVD